MDRIYRNVLFFELNDYEVNKIELNEEMSLKWSEGMLWGLPFRKSKREILKKNWKFSRNGDKLWLNTCKLLSVHCFWSCEACSIEESQGIYRVEALWNTRNEVMRVNVVYKRISWSNLTTLPLWIFQVSVIYQLRYQISKDFFMDRWYRNVLFFGLNDHDVEVME